MTDEDKVKYIEKTKYNLLIYFFKYISRNEYKSKANEVFGNIGKELLKDILKVLHPSLHVYFYACLDKDSTEYVCKHYYQYSDNLIGWVIFIFESDGIEDKKMLLRFVKDLADNSECKERIIDGLMYINKTKTDLKALDVIVNGVETESECLPGLITGEFLKSIFEKESDINKKHDIIRKVVWLLRYFKSDDAVKDVLSVITDMEALEKALDKIEEPVDLARVLNIITNNELLIRATEALVLLIERGEYGLLGDVLNVISNKSIARVVVQKCVVHMKKEALVQTANSIKDKEIVYCIMEVLKQNGMLMDRKIISSVGYNTASVVLYGVPGASDKPRLMESHEAAKILECMNDEQKYAIGDVMEDISLAEELNKIGADNIEGLRATFDSRNRGMTVMLFKHLDIDVMKTIVHVMMNPNEKKSLLMELSLPIAESMGQYLYYVQEIIDKVWQVYGVGSVSDLLLDMSDKERKKVLKQLGCEHKIDVLIHVGTEKKYENAEGRKYDVKRIFSAIDDERRKELLNDIIIDEKEGVPYYATDTFNELMKVLKEASIEHNEIAHMLLGVKDKRLLISMIDWISILHGDEYMADILLSIDDNLLRSMISKLKDKPVLIARILGGADEVSKLRRLLNIIVLDGISNENMEIELGKLVINENIVSELIDKLEDEQNEILGKIDTQLADKIKCAIKKAEEQAKPMPDQETRIKEETETEIKPEAKRKKTENTDEASQVVQQSLLAQSIRIESLRGILNRCGSILYNMHKISNGSIVELESNEVFMQEGKFILKEFSEWLIRSKKLADSGALKMSRVVENRNIIDRFEAINGMISGMEESMNDTGILILKDDLKSMNEKLHKMVCDMIIDTSKLDDYTIEYLHELVSVMDAMMSKAEGLKEGYKEIYDQVVMLYNEIENNICIYLIETMLNAVNLIYDEIDKVVVKRHNEEYIKRFRDENKSISDLSKFSDEMLKKMMPAQLKEIMLTVLQIICKQLINKDYQLSHKESEENVEKVIKELPHLGVLIDCSESNVLDSEVKNNISMRNRLMIFILFMVLYDMGNQKVKDFINQLIQNTQSIKDDNQPMPASQVS